ncbi:MAG: four helix bundle protein [Rickettsiales bacterium]|jgi:four helix bundle protein|nr:four helix bundle protein [Rickettsiales bacterium]
MKKDNLCLLKSETFAIRIVKLYNYLKDNKKEFVLSKQILRSGTSIGANISESEYAISRDDFISKMHIAVKECSETLFWLKLLKNTQYISQKEFDSINQDCDEICKILVASIKTAKNKKGKDKK